MSNFNRKKWIHRQVVVGFILAIAPLKFTKKRLTHYGPETIHWSIYE